MSHRCTSAILTSPILLGAISAGVGAGVGALEGADEAARVREVASPWIRWKIAVTAGRT
jgi:hypothetical protein